MAHEPAPPGWNLTLSQLQAEVKAGLRKGLTGKEIFWGREYEVVQGFDWISGEVVKITPGAGRKVPHMGWNDLVIDHAHPVLAGIETGDHAYFVHSYHFKVSDPAHRIAHVDFGGDITAIIGRDNMVGTQFHPEKSQKAGLRLIANFLTWTP